jgi:hypothetical protein
MPIFSDVCLDICGAEADRVSGYHDIPGGRRVVFNIPVEHEASSRLKSRFGIATKNS